MARKKSLDELKQDSAKHSRRAAETRRAIAWANVQIIIKANMWAADDVERYLGDLGSVVEDGRYPSKGGEVEPSRTKVGVQKREESRKRKEQEDQVSMVQELQVACIDEVVPTKYYKLGQLSYSLLVTKVMPRIEPMSYSAGSVADKQAKLLRRLEFDTGLGLCATAGPLRHRTASAPPRGRVCGMQGWSQPSRSRQSIPQQSRLEQLDFARNTHGRPRTMSTPCPRCGCRLEWKVTWRGYTAAEWKAGLRQI